MDGKGGMVSKAYWHHTLRAKLESKNKRKNNENNRQEK